MEPSSCPIPARTLSSAGQCVVLIMVGSVFGLLGVAGLVMTGDAASIAIYAGCLAFGGWIAFRACFLGLRIDTGGVTERGLGRSRSVAWCEIREAYLDARGTGPVQSVLPGVVLRSGERVPFQAIASYSRRAAQQRMNALRSAHAAHLAVCPACTPVASDASG